MRPLGGLITFISVAVAMILFRSPTLASAIDLMKGLVAENGVALPQAIYDHLGPLAGWLHRTGVASVAPELWSGEEYGRMVMWILVSLFIALSLPNTLQILARYEPALGVKPQTVDLGRRSVSEWNASLPWAISVAIVAAMATLSLGGPSEFLYWQF
jgi:hypothetical protein